MKTMYMFKYCCDSCNETWYRLPEDPTSKESAMKVYDCCKFTSVVCPICEVDELYLDSVVQVTTSGMEEVTP